LTIRDQVIQIIRRKSCLIVFTLQGSLRREDCGERFYLGESKQSSMVLPPRDPFMAHSKTKTSRISAI